MSDSDDDAMVLEVRGSHQDGAELVDRCVSLFGPPTSVCHGRRRTYLMEFSHRDAQASVAAIYEAPGEWRFQLTVRSASHASSSAWGDLRETLALEI